MLQGHPNPEKSEVVGMDSLQNGGYLSDLKTKPAVN